MHSGKMECQVTSIFRHHLNLKIICTEMKTLEVDQIIQLIFQITESVTNFNLAICRVIINKELKIDNRTATKIMDNKEIGLHNKMFNNKMFTINKEFHLKLTKIFNSNYKMLVDKLLSKEDSHKINHLYNNKIDKQTIE